MTVITGDLGCPGHSHVVARLTDRCIFFHCHTSLFVQYALNDFDAPEHVFLAFITFGAVTAYPFGQPVSYPIFRIFVFACDSAKFSKEMVAAIVVAAVEKITFVFPRIAPV